MQLHLLVLQSLAKAFAKLIDPAAGAASLPPSTPARLSTRREVDHLIALYAPERELALFAKRAQQRPIQQTAIYDPYVADLLRQSQLTSQLARKCRRAAPFDIQQRADQHRGPELLLAVAV
jgi:hypothetical protein